MEYPQTIQVNLNGVATDPDDPDEQITYSIVSNSNSNALTATVNGKNLVLTRRNPEQATANLTMRATSDGQYVNFTVHVVMNHVYDGMGEHEMGMTLYPNPTDGKINIAFEDQQGFDYTVYDIVGQTVMQGQSRGGAAQVDLSGLQKGVYFIALVRDKSIRVEKVIVK